MEASSPTTHTPVSARTGRGILLSLLLSFTGLGVVAWFTFDPVAFSGFLSFSSIVGIAVAIALVAMRVCIGGMRLSYVSRGRMSLRGGIKGQLSWDFFSNITPSAIGGGPFSAVFVARDARIPVGDATAFILFCVLLDQLWFAITLPVLVLASLFLDLIPESLGSIGLGLFLACFGGMLLWVIGFAYLTLVRPDLIERTLGYIFRMRWLRKFEERAALETERLSRRAMILRSQPPGFYAKGILLTGAYWLTRYALVVAIVAGVYLEVDVVLMLLRSAALTFASLILPTPGGAGGLEGMYVLLFGPMMPEAAVAPTLLAWRFLGFYIFIAIGVLMTTRHLSIKRKRTHTSCDGATSDVEETDVDEPAALVLQTSERG
jgi:glycosyltransferase 2 family protein